MSFGAVVKVCADSQQNNKQGLFCTLKLAILLNFVKFHQKAIFSPQGWF